MQREGKAARDEMRVFRREMIDDKKLPARRTRLLPMMPSTIHL